MADIDVTHNPDESILDGLGVRQWDIWSKEISEFPWHYDSTETCYILAGEVTVIPDGGSEVTIGKGDLVTFAQGLSCTWKISQPVKKYYRFE